MGWIVIAIGTFVALSGVRKVSRQKRSWPQWALLYLSVFRRVVVGLCIAGAGVGWVEHLDWLLAASICIGIGELLESSYYIGVLRWGRALDPPSELGGFTAG
jgi:hypothetical protein